MRVLIDGNVHEPLSPAEEQDVRQFSAEESVQGSVLSADEATSVRVGQTKRVLIIFWGLIPLPRRVSPRSPSRPTCRWS